MALIISCWGILSFIFAILLPPIGVVMHKGCGKDFIIDLLLTILGYIPGVIYAVIIVLCTSSTVYAPGLGPNIMPPVGTTTAYGQ